ncbi:hypothetical protein J1605_015108 [Eschrichtius robustus]|uniref:Uncharacterized protein n=1 Tax=Eschrichtius robustus TaxID=9764 RepID=A0AB34GBX0_ESCRO|nr:hypothetical protein J1605_015108 [Eschrichtius robustus]
MFAQTPGLISIRGPLGSPRLGMGHCELESACRRLQSQDVLSQTAKVGNRNKAGGLGVFLIEAELLQPTQPPRGLTQKNKSYSLSGIDGYYPSSDRQFWKRRLASPGGPRQLRIRKRYSSEYCSIQSPHFRDEEKEPGSHS